MDKEDHVKSVPLLFRNKTQQCGFEYDAALSAVYAVIGRMLLGSC